MDSTVEQRIGDVLSWKEGCVLVRERADGGLETAVVGGVDSNKGIVTLLLPSGEERVLTLAYAVRTNWRHKEEAQTIRLSEKTLKFAERYCTKETKLTLRERVEDAPTD